MSKPGVDVHVDVKVKVTQSVSRPGSLYESWLWSGAMSESTPEDPPAPASPAAAADGAVAPVSADSEIKVEVEAPAAPAAVDWEAKAASLEQSKKENWDRYLRAAADLENFRKRTKRELEDAKY